MITLRTKNKHTVLHQRSFTKKHVYLVINQVDFNCEGVTPYGYYYYTHENELYKLDDIVPSLIEWSQLHQLEETLDTISTHSTLTFIKGRILSLTLLRLEQEGRANYNIPPTDWEEYNEPA